MTRSPEPEAATGDWASVGAGELAARTPRVQPNADAEALFWRVWVEDKLATFGLQSEYRHYVRIKVFTERGCRSQAVVNLACGWNARIDDVAGRTVRPDGGVVFLRPEDIHERTLVQAGKRRSRLTSFVLPAVAPGSIIEYHWRETRKGEISAYGRLECQRDIPVREATYRISPLTVEGRQFAVKTRSFNLANVPIVKDASGDLIISVSDVPAFHPQPYMPPPAEVRPWVLYFYAEQERGALPVWAKQLYEGQIPTLKPSRLVRETATRAMAGARDRLDSLSHLYSYCQDNVRNASEDGSGLPRAVIEALDDNATAEETLKKLAGTSPAINQLFCLLARAAGFEARMALSGDASDVLPVTQRSSRSFFTSYVVAIPDGPDWLFFDPGTRSAPFGTLPWQKERSAILVPDAVAPAVVEPVPARPESSRVSRRALLRLDEDGSLEGQVRIEYRGHLAMIERDEHAGMSIAGWSRSVRERFEEELGAAEVSDVRIACPRDGPRPCVYEFRLRLPGNAMVSENRIIANAAIFHAGQPPPLPSRERKAPVRFPYSWSEIDSIAIALPPPFALEAADRPIEFDLWEGARYGSELSMSADSSTLTLVRSRRITGVLMAALDYPVVWDGFHQACAVDNRTFSLRRRRPR